MARTKISEFSATAADNTDIDNIDIAEGCAPSGINNAIREMMAQLKDFQTGAAGDSFNGPVNGALNGSLGATTPDTVVATQVDITAQGDLRLQDTTGGQYVALQAPSTVASSYTLTLPVDDGTAGQALITDGSGVLSWSSAASGDVYGPASATDNAVARYDGTTGKIIQNSAVTIADDGATVIAANSTSDGLRITQTGIGNALLVEDSANPDATPFVVNADGRVLIGSQTVVTDSSGAARNTQLLGTGGVNSGELIARFSADINPSALYFAKSRGATIGTQTIVSSGDEIGRIGFDGSDGTNFVSAALIQAFVDGTPGTNDMPGRLVFSTTADGASSPTERMRIDNAGQVGIGGTPAAGRTLTIQKNLSGSVNTRGIFNAGVVQSDSTSQAFYNATVAQTAAASFSCANLTHYYANQGTFGVGSSVVSQYGFYVENTLTGATNNYGFYSNIASGTGRWNFYANGTAENYFGGNTVINVTDNTNAALRITQLGTGNALVVEDSTNPDATPFVVDATGDVLIGTSTTIPGAFSDTGKLQIAQNTGEAGIQNFAFTNATGGAIQYFNKSRSATIGTNTIVQSGDTLGNITFAGADGASYIRAASITSDVDGTPGTNDMPGRLVFSTTADGASTPTERMRIGSAGSVGIGGYAAQINLYNTKSITGATFSYAYSATNAVQSDVTNTAAGYHTTLSTQAAAFTLSNLNHYWATQGTIGATSAVTNQYGFHAASSLTGATNNYGFYSNIASGTGRWNFYAAGTADNYFAGKVGVGMVPSNQLDVSASTYCAVGVTSGSVQGQIAANSSGSVDVRAVSNHAVILYSNNTERMRITNAGVISLGAAPGSESLRVTPVASAVNYLNVQGSITGGNPSLIAQGSDTNINVYYGTKGSGLHYFATGTGQGQFVIAHTASAVNYLQVTGGATGNAATLSAQGSDTNIDLNLTPKGTGNVRFGTHTASADVAISGYIEIKDAAGNIRKLAVIS